MKQSVEKNIPRLLVIRVIRWFLLIMPVIVLFYQENGLDMKQVMILQSFYSIIVVLFEVPSGYLSDILGRKKTLVFANILTAAGFIIFSLSFGFWGFLIAELFLGVGGSFISGTDSAMIYDTLCQLKKENEYKKHEGIYSAAGNFSEAGAAIIGAALAGISLRVPLIAETALTVLNIPLALTLIEPLRVKLDNSKGNWQTIKEIARFSLIEHKEIKWLILYSSVLGTGSLIIAWFCQPYLKLSGLPLAWFGAVWAVVNLSVGIFSWFAHGIEGFFGRKKVLISLYLLLSLGFLLIGIFQSLWAIPLLIIFYFVRGLSTPVIKDYINRLIESDKRATVLSIKNLIARLIFSVTAPFAGWISDVYTLPVALLLSGGMALLFGSVTLFFMKKHDVL